MGGSGFFMICGQMGDIKADDSTGTSTNNTTVSAAPAPVAKTAPTTNVKPSITPSTPKGRLETNPELGSIDRWAKSALR
jgi:hypothetical protein